MKFGKSAAYDGIYTLNESMNHNGTQIINNLQFIPWCMISIESDIESWNIFDLDAIQPAPVQLQSGKNWFDQKLLPPDEATPETLANWTLDSLDALNLAEFLLKCNKKSAQKTMRLITTPWGSMRSTILYIVWLISVSWQTDLYPKLHRVWYLGLSKDLLRMAISLWIPRRHFSEITLWLICVLMSMGKLWKIDEEVPPNVLGFGIANLLLAPLSCQKHGSPRTLEGQARKSHSSRLLKWTLDYSKNNSFMKFDSSSWTMLNLLMHRSSKLAELQVSKDVSVGFEPPWPECLKVLFHRPSQNKSTQDCSVGSQVPTKYMACPCLLSPKNWETQHLPGDSKWPFLIHLLCFDSHTWMSLVDIV